MADLIKINGGNGAAPQLDDRELGYRKDEEALYIGTNNGNIRLCGAKDKQDTKEYIDGLILSLTERIEGFTSTIEDINSRLDAMVTPNE